MGSIVGNKIDYNGIGTLRGQWHMPANINPRTPPPRVNRDLKIPDPPIDPPGSIGILRFENEDDYEGEIQLNVFHKFSKNTLLGKLILLFFSTRKVNTVIRLFLLKEA